MVLIINNLKILNFNKDIVRLLFTLMEFHGVVQVNNYNNI